MKKIEFLVILLIIILAGALRLYKVNRPIADWHSWRQADTAAVSRNFIKDGFNFITPRYDDMSTQTNGLDNPNRYRFVEFPIYNAIVALVWKVTGVAEVYARLTTVVISLISTALLFFLVRKFSNFITAALASFFFAIVPYNVFYSSTILPAPFMVASILALYVSFANWLENQKNIFWYISSIIFANLAILSWPIALFFMLPVAYLSFQKFGLSAFKKKSLWAFAVVSMLPFIAWRIWMMRFPEGIPNFQFLLNENNIRFKGAFFRWIVIERLGKLILTVSGFALLIIGIVQKPQHKEKLFYLSILASVALYFSVFASGNVRHDYYQIPAIPALCIFMAIGARTMFFGSKDFVNLFVARFLAVFLIVFMFVFGTYEVQGYYWINKPQIVEAGKAVDRLLPKDATVIAPYNGDTAFLYQTNRRGYPITDRPLEKFIEQGTKYLVSVDVNDAGIQNLAKNCKVIDQTKNYVIVEMFTECIGK